MKQLSEKEIRTRGVEAAPPLKDGTLQLRLRGAGEVVSVSTSERNANILQGKVNDGSYRAALTLTADEARVVAKLGDDEIGQLVADTSKVRRYLDPNCRLHGLRVAP